VDASTWILLGLVVAAVAVALARDASSDARTKTEVGLYAAGLMNNSS